MCRFRLDDLLVRMCCLNALLRTNLPPAVFLKRFAAPRCVLSFGISVALGFHGPAEAGHYVLFFCFYRRRLARRCAASACGLLRQDGVHLIAFLARHRLGNRDIGQLIAETLENAPPDFRVRHLAAAKENRGLHLVALSEEALDVLLLELIVVLVDLGPEFDFFDVDDLLMLLRLARPLLFLVLIFPEIHDPADGRHCGRRNLHQIQPLRLRNDQGLRRGHDAQLLPVIVNDPNFPYADAFVYANPVVTPRSRSIESYKTSWR